MFRWVSKSKYLNAKAEIEGYKNQNTPGKSPPQILGPSPTEKLGTSGAMKMLDRHFEIWEKIQLGTKPSKSQINELRRFDPIKGT